MTLVVHYDLELHQMDANTIFLNGDLLDNVYMAQPKDFASEMKRTHEMLSEVILLWIKTSL
jgi:hypothetical protein